MTPRICTACGEAPAWLDGLCRMCSNESQRPAPVITRHQGIRRLHASVEAACRWWWANADSHVLNIAASPLQVAADIALDDEVTG